MNYDKTKEEIRYSLFAYIGLFFMMYITDSGYANYSYLGYHVKIYGIIFMASIFLLTNLKKMIHQFDAKVLFLLSAILLSGLINKSSMGLLLAYLFTLLFSYCFVTKISFKAFCNVLLRLMRFVSLWSLALYIIVVFFPQIAEYIPIVEYNYNVSSPTPYYETFFSHLSLSVWNVQRNHGPFWEPGVFQVYLIFALLISIFQSSVKTLWRDVILFGTTIITTFSTTGYITFCIALLCIVFVRENELGGKWKIAIASGFLIVIGFWAFGEQLYNFVFYKLGEEGVDNGSYISRLVSVRGNIALALKNPILGVGYSNSNKILNSLYSNVYDKMVHQTNTLMNYFASFGLIIGAFFSFMWLRVARKLAKYKKMYILVFATIILSLSGENMISSICINVFMFYGLNTLSDIEENREEI